MGFLHMLWDETVAGPTPDSGLGKLRKYNSFHGARSFNAAAPVDDQIPITRSITIVHSNPTPATQLPTINVLRSGSCSDSLPSSPAASSTTGSPRSPSTPGGNVKKFVKKKPNLPYGEPKSPTGYDWIVLSALDR